jgi:hypothetical protein
VINAEPRFRANESRGSVREMMIIIEKKRREVIVASKNNIIMILQVIPRIRSRNFYRKWFPR